MFLLGGLCALCILPNKSTSSSRDRDLNDRLGRVIPTESGCGLDAILVHLGTRLAEPIDVPHVSTQLIGLGISPGEPIALALEPFVIVGRH